MRIGFFVITLRHIYISIYLNKCLLERTLFVLRAHVAIPAIRKRTLSPAVEIAITPDLFDEVLAVACEAI